MNKFIILFSLFIIAFFPVFSQVGNSQFILLNEKFGNKFNTGAIATNNEGSIYFVSGDSPQTSYKQIYSFKDGKFTKILGIDELKAISDTIYNEINSIYFSEGKLFITANPHLFEYDFSNLIKLTPNLVPNYLREVIDVENKNGVLYFLISDNQVISNIPSGIKTIIANDKIMKYDGIELKTIIVDDSVTINNQSIATGFTLDENDKIWFTFDSKQNNGGGLASFDGTKFDVFNIEFYNEKNTLFKTNDIKIFNDKKYISFKYNNLTESGSDGFGGFISFDSETWHFFDRAKINDFSNANINDFIIIDEENIWLAGSGLIHINSRTNVITQYKINEIFDLPTNDYNVINFVDYDKFTNILWFSTNWSGIGYIDNVTTKLENKYNANIINFYPNPVKDKLNIILSKSDFDSKLTIDLFDINGNLLENIYNNYPQNNIQINTGKLVNGVYFIVMDSKTKRIIKKFEKSS